MHRCFGCLIPLGGLQDFMGQPDPAPTVPSSFTSSGVVTWENAATPAMIGVGFPAKANFVAGTDYLLFTAPGGVTHAFWFDTTGGDSEPAGSVAADNSYQVDISGDTTAQDVLATLLAAINTAAIGVTAKNWGGTGLVIEVDTPGAAGNSWGIEDFVGHINFEVGGVASGEGNTFEGGIDTGTVIPDTEDGSSYWVGDVDQVTPTVLTFSIKNSGQLLLELADPTITLASSDATPTPTQPADLTLESGESIACSVSMVADAAAACDIEVTFDSTGSDESEQMFCYFLGIGV